MSRLIKNLSRNGFGNVLNDQQFSLIYGMRNAGNYAGILVPTLGIMRVSGEPPIAKTRGWGQVPGQS